MIPTQHTLDTPYPVGPVHCYSTELNGELTLFDTGPPTEEAKTYLRSHLDLNQLKQVILTHCHIDHYGLAAWLEQTYGASVYLPYRDSLKIVRHVERLEKMTALLGDIGFDQQFMELFHTEIDNDSVFPDFPKQFKVIEQELPSELAIEIIPCPGHSQSDLILAGQDWAVTGDVMLRGIFQSPLLDVDLLTGQRFSNYNAYCETIVKLASLREKKILPGHREFIIGVDFNICFYSGKLLERAERIRKYPAELSVAQVVAQLSGDSLENPFHRYLKASEILLIRDFLAEPEKLQQSLEEIGLFPELAELFQRATGATDGSSHR